MAPMFGGAIGHNPHDTLVRYTFSRLEAVAIALRRVIDPALWPCIDFDSLEALPTVDADCWLRNRRADLRFKVDLVDRGVRVSILVAIEHQSTLDTLLACRMHVYVGDMWIRFAHDCSTSTTVPAVLPILLAQRPAGKTPRRLSSLFGLTPKLRRLLGPTVDLELRVDDLSGSVLDDPMARPGPLALVELTRALLHAHGNPSALTPERMATLAPQFDILLNQSPPLGTHDVRALWQYVVKVFKPDSALRTLIVESVSKEAKQMYITIADALRAEGRAEALLDVLEHRALPVSPSMRDRLLATHDEAQLQRWLRRALTIDSADELFEATGH
ncbi:MAG: Rpn family recombination-promoting nuclease/putative transposase [Myxococcota bacterium]